MDWFYAAALGVLEGVTEFLPVSSTAHLLLAKELLGLGADWDSFVILIQLGAILAVVAIYFSRFWNIALRLPHDPGARRFVFSVIVGTIPAIFLGLALHDFIKRVLFESPKVICWSLLVGGFVLLAVDRLGRSGRWRDAFALPFSTSFGIGVAQCLALVPGVSRSGATITGGLLLGLDKRAATEFSFFLAIPAMVGAFALDFYKSHAQLSHHSLALIAVGFVVAFISALGVIKLFLDYVGRHGFWPFALWRIAVGGVGLAVLYLVH